MRHLYWIGPIALTFVTIWIGCGDDVETSGDGTGGAGATGGSTSSPTAATTDTSSSTGTSMTSCDGAPDDYCDPDNGEDCDCPDCELTGYCVQGACDAEDGECHYAADSCVCPDCDLDYLCSDPGDFNCTDDGTCENYEEGCACADCYADPQCVDNAAACNGGAPDDTCDVGEDCICPDCAGTVQCVPCTDDGECGFTEGCLCTDCVADDFCTDPDNCEIDGICAPLYEDCNCADCAGEALCAGTGGAGGN